MEGQTHTWTRSLAELYTLVHSCNYLYTQYAYIQIFVDARKLPASTHQGSSVSTSPLLSPAVDTLGALRQCRPCFLILPSRPLTIRTDKSYQKLYPHLSWLSRLISFCSFTASVFYVLLWSFSVCVCVFTQLSNLWDPHAALLFSNHRSLEAKVNCQGFTFTVTFNRSDQLP